jgi:hypothetical protein
MGEKAAGRPSFGPRLATWSAGLIVVVATLVVFLLPATALARKPIISYVEGNQLRLYDAELNQDLAPPPVTVADPAQFRYGMSLNGRYIFFTDANKKLHLLDRTIDQEISLPGIDVYPNPNFLTVSNDGLLAFDNNANGPAVVYNAATHQFVPTGLPPNNGHRQTKLSGNGQFLATTCLTNCVVDFGGDSNPYVQNLVTQTDTGVPDDPNTGEEDPCINGDGNLVGWHAGNPNAASQQDIFVYDRSSATFLSLPGLNDPVEDDTFCVLDAAGDYIGFQRQNAGFKLYERASATILPLPNKPFDTRSTFSAPLEPASSAAAAPSNEFTLGKPKRNKKKGTAKLPAVVPGPGTLVLVGKGLKSDTEEVGAAGEVKLAVKPTGKKKGRLEDKGKTKVDPEVTYTPTGGTPNTQDKKFKLKKR